MLYVAHKAGVLLGDDPAKRIEILQWVRTLHKSYQATDVLHMSDFPQVNDWLGRCQARPASQAAVRIPAQA